MSNKRHPDEYFEWFAKRRKKHKEQTDQRLRGRWIKRNSGLNRKQRRAMKKNNKT